MENDKLGGDARLGGVFAGEVLQKANLQHYSTWQIHQEGVQQSLFHSSNSNHK
jgi:hypothetical protein